MKKKVKCFLIYLSVAVPCYLLACFWVIQKYYPEILHPTPTTIALPATPAKAETFTIGPCSVAKETPKTRPKGFALASYSESKKEKMVFEPILLMAEEKNCPISEHIMVSLKRIPYIIKHYGFFINYLSDNYEFNPLLITADLGIESMGYWFVVSDSGAIGLKQLMPRTAKNFYLSSYLKCYRNIIDEMKNDGAISEEQYLKMIPGKKDFLAVPDKYKEKLFAILEKKGIEADSSFLGILFNPYFNIYLGANYMYACAWHRGGEYDEGYGIQAYFDGPYRKGLVKNGSGYYEKQPYYRKVKGLMNLITLTYPELLPQIGIETEVGETSTEVALVNN